MPIWAKVLLVISSYGLILLLCGALFDRAPMDPEDDSTRDDEK